MLTPSELESVIDDVLRGNRDAFRKIVQEFGLYIRSYIAIQIHHLDVIDDLAQDVFFAAFRNLDEFQRGNELSAWLRGIARNKVSEYFRSISRREKAMDRFREEVVGLCGAMLDRSMEFERTETIEVLLSCITRLPDRMRRVVRAGLDGHRPVDLAAELNTSVGAVYSMHYRANQLLRECVSKVLE
jgi:RNA polymerase sigma-70 factor (ECF subfamily)